MFARFALRPVRQADQNKTGQALSGQIHFQIDPKGADPVQRATNEAGDHVYPVCVASSPKKRRVFAPHSRHSTSVSSPRHAATVWAVKAT